MILTVLGTDEHPFERALDAVAVLRPHGLIVQRGHTPRRDWPETKWLDIVAFDALVSYMNEADGIVCHAGVGTIMTVLELGRRPVVIPRLAAYGEHVDDHQLQIVEKLHASGLVVPLLNGTSIEAAVEESRGESAEWPFDSRLSKAVAAAANAGS